MLEPGSSEEARVRLMTICTLSLVIVLGPRVATADSFVFRTPVVTTNEINAIPHDATPTKPPPVPPAPKRNWSLGRRWRMTSRTGSGGIEPIRIGAARTEIDAAVSLCGELTAAQRGVPDTASQSLPRTKVLLAKSWLSRHKILTGPDRRRPWDLPP